MRSPNPKIERSLRRRAFLLIDAGKPSAAFILSLRQASTCCSRSLLRETIFLKLKIRTWDILFTLQILCRCFFMTATISYFHIIRKGSWNIKYHSHLVSSISHIISGVWISLWAAFTTRTTHIVEYITKTFITFCIFLCERHRGVMINVPNYSIVASEFELYTRVLVHFRINKLGIGIRRLILQTMD